jgi:glycolate oxidase iron-sulfur subunit
MQTNLSPEYAARAEGLAAQAILRKCVHCGFCTATCPTYQLLGDELDGPRGRIYLIKQVLEGAKPTRKTQEHLDRCLTCRNCETTCPSGVQYGELVDIGRALVDEKVQRPLSERATRWALKEGLPSAAFGPAMRVGQAVRGVLPKGLKAKVPAKQALKPRPAQTHVRKMLLLEGCVQPSMSPNINSATARVLDACGIQAVTAPKAGCCGAVKFHLNDHFGGQAHMRANVDAWWPLIESGEVEKIVMTASGCGVMVKEYGHHLAHDPAYAAKAKIVSSKTVDLSELLIELTPKLREKLSTSAKSGAKPGIVFHPPCTLQHGQKLKGGVEQGLIDLGFDVHLASRDAHLCCGSAGTYSVLQAALSQQLRERKMAALTESLEKNQAQVITSANIGCITHLQAATAVPVRHWVEVLDDALGG